MVQLNCKVEFGPEETMSWEFKGNIIYSVLGKTEDYPLKNHQKYSVKWNGNINTLTVKDLLFEDGGVYMCVVFVKQAKSVLLVLGEPSLTPSGQTLMAGDTAEFTCEVYFGGPNQEDIGSNQHLKLNIYLENHQSNVKNNNTELINLGLVYQLRRVSGIRVESGMDGAKLICELWTSFTVLNVTAISVLHVQQGVSTIGIIMGLLCLLVIPGILFVLWKHRRKLRRQRVNQYSMDTTEDIKQMLENTPNRILYTEKPSAFVRVINEAEALIQDTNYVNILRKMVPIYENYQNKLQEDPLLCLVEQLEIGPATSLVQHNEKLFELIRLLLHLEGKSCTRGRCMQILMKTTREGKQSQDMIKPDDCTPKGDSFFQWNVDFISVLKLLVKGRADQTNTEDSNLHLLSRITPYILPCESEILDNLLQLFAMMITSKTPDNQRYLEGETPLHYFAESMSRLPNHFPNMPTEIHTKIIAQLLEVIKSLKNGKPELFDCSTTVEKTALHGFINGIILNFHNELNEEILQFTNAIAKQMKTHNNVNIQYDDGSTLLHVLIKELSSTMTTETKNQVLDLLYTLKSSCNVDSQDKDGNTTLHCWVEKSDKWAADPDFFVRIVQALVSGKNVCMQDSKGNKPHELFVFKASWHNSNPKPFQEVLNFLKYS